MPVAVVFLPTVAVRAVVVTASAAPGHRLEVGIGFFLLSALFHLADVVTHLLQQQQVQILILIRFFLTLIIVFVVRTLAPLLLFLLVLLPLFFGLLNLKKMGNVLVIGPTTEARHENVFIHCKVFMRETETMWTNPQLKPLLNT